LDALFNLQRGPTARFGLKALRGPLQLLAKTGFQLDVQGMEHLPATGPYLLCPTHASRLDGALIFLALPSVHLEQMFFLGAEQYFQSPLMRRIGKLARVIPTATADTVRASLQRAAEALAMGRSLCIFPEGLVTRDGNLNPPRPGIGILACEFQVPVVPVLMRGTYASLSFAHPKFRFIPTGITFAKPIQPPPKDSYSSDEYAQITTAWHQAVIALRQADDASGSRTAGLSPRIPESSS
jgi:long-chain acyl-CoA synthetase